MRSSTSLCQRHLIVFPSLFPLSPSADRLHPPPPASPFAIIPACAPARALCSAPVCASHPSIYFSTPYTMNHARYRRFLRHPSKERSYDNLAYIMFLSIKRFFFFHKYHCGKRITSLILIIERKVCEL